MSYLDVDEVLALDDDLDVGVVDRLLVVLYARRPVCCRPQHLRHGEEEVTGSHVQGPSKHKRLIVIRENQMLWVHYSVYYDNNVRTFNAHFEDI